MLEAVLIMVATLQLGQQQEQAIVVRRSIPLNQPVTTPRDAVHLAKLDAEALDATELDSAKFSRYVWIPDWIEPASGFAQVSFVANSTFSRTSNIIQPTVIADGKLVRLDLVKYASRDEQIGEIVNLYEKLADHDSYFNVKVRVDGPVAIVQPDGSPTVGDAVQIKTQSGNWADAKIASLDGPKWGIGYSGKTYPTPLDQIKWKGKLASELGQATPVPGVQEVFAAAPYLKPDGPDLFRITRSDVPIMRLDEWVAFTFSTVNGGLYYPLTGIRSTLAETIEEFAGKDAAQKVTRLTQSMRRAQAENRQTGEAIVKVAGRLDPELAKSKALIETSEVTGRQRIAAFFFGAGTAPTSGVQLVAVTFDIAEDNIDPNSDPLRNAAVFETYNGGEAIFALPNGMLAYVVFNQNDVIIASVPDSVAHDFRARLVRSNASTVRVFSGVSCANCHDWQAGNWGWQPVVNDLHDTARGLAKILDDRGRRSSIEALQTITAQYSASTLDLKAMLNQARVPYQYRAGLATNQETTRETVAGLADSYWGYWYDQVTATVAARDLGQSLTAEQAQLFLLRAIDPEPVVNAESLLREDIALVRVKDGLHVTPAQWRTVFQNVAERTLFKPLETGGISK